MGGANKEAVWPVVATLAVLWGGLPFGLMPLWICILFTAAGAMFVVEESR